MKERDRIYQLFTEANPAPENAVPTTERPDADAILAEQRNPTMLTEEPRTIESQPAPVRSRTWRGPAVALGTFVGAAVLGVAVWLIMANGDSDVADGSTLPPVTTTVPPVTTTVPDVVVVPGTLVSVPGLTGLTLAEAKGMLGDAGLEVLALPDDNDAAIVMAQEPSPGAEVEEGTVVTVDVRPVANCNPPDPLAPGPGQVTISVFYECGNDGFYPTAGIGVPRIVPEQDEAVDRIEWTLRSLLAGPTADEEDVGFASFFGEATAGALNGVTLTSGALVVDFNEAIYVNNASTSTGGLFFGAELDRNVFSHPEVETVEFRVDGDCEAWSAFFQSDGCWVTSRSDWDRSLAEWDAARNQ
ncbi:MAG: PASTA domain-containing protein [Acidimicrobiia bacterium]|nr:PASTA domain-containing protein [Acidimicrobiia bacterium]